MSAFFFFQRTLIRTENRSQRFCWIWVSSIYKPGLAWLRDNNRHYNLLYFYHNLKRSFALITQFLRVLLFGWSWILTDSKKCITKGVAKIENIKGEYPQGRLVVCLEYKGIHGQISSSHGVLSKRMQMGLSLNFNC